VPEKEVLAKLYEGERLATSIARYFELSLGKKGKRVNEKTCATTGSKGIFDEVTGGVRGYRRRFRTASQAKTRPRSGEALCGNN